MEIQHEVAKGAGCGASKHVQHLLPSSGKRLQQHVTHAQLIARILERDDVMRVSGNALGVFSRRKHVLAKVQHRDVAMMRILGENVQNVNPLWETIDPNPSPTAPRPKTSRPSTSGISFATSRSSNASSWDASQKDPSCPSTDAR